MLVALISSVSTKVEVTKIVAENQREQARSTIDMIRRWRDEQGSWQGADRLFAETATAEHQQLLVLGTDNHCVKSFPAGLCKMHISIGPGDELTIGSIGPQDEDIRVLVGVPEIVVTDGQKNEQGWKLLVLPSEPARQGVPDRFFSSMSRSLAIGGGVAALVALCVSLMLARTLLKPIRELATLVQCIHRGDFSKRVAVHGQDEIGMLGAAFNSAAEELTRQEQLRKDLLHDVAHELRSPLTNIRCQLESLQDGLTSATAETLGSIYEEAMHLSRLVDDLRDIALAEAGHLSLEIVDCNATLELHRVMRTASPIANARSIRMVLDAPPFLWVSADPGRLAQIMNNLVVNAIQHTPTGCFVTIRARAEGSLALIEVADDGPGIPAEHLPFIFDRFYRVDPSRSRKTSGAGLGLAIAKQLATLQGGSLKVKSEGGHGSCFILSVPLQLSTRE